MAQATQQRGTARAHSSASGDDAASGGWRAPLRWARSHRAVSLTVAGLVSVALPIVAVWLSASRAEGPKPPTLQDALAALDRGDLKAAHNLAQVLRRQDAPKRSEAGGPAYVLGAIAARQADQSTGAARHDHDLLAIRYMQEARQRGFPADRQSEGLLLLARRLSSDGQVREAQQVLEEGLKSAPQPSLFHHHLADACSHDSPPKLAEALEHNRHYVSDPALTDEERQHGMVEQADLLFRHGDDEAARAILTQIPAQSTALGNALLVEGEIRLQQAKLLPDADAEQAAKRSAALRSAIDALRQAAARSAESRLAGRAMYLIGVCYREQGDARAALEQFARTHVVHQESPEGFIAGIEQAELLLQAGRDAEAVIAFRRVLFHFAGPERYENRWLPIQQLQRRVMAAFDQLRDQQKYEPALELTASLSPLFSPASQAELTARARRAWGESLIQKAAQPPVFLESAPLRNQGLALLRQAGDDFARLAQLRFASREHTTDLWESAECYQAGRGFARAVEAFKKYLDEEPNRQRSEALLQLGEAQLAEDRLAEAIATLHDAMQWDPRNAATYRARILSSQAQVELGDLSASEALLLANLNDDYLTPASLEWRESLFALGRLLHLEGRYQEAVDKLQEAVARYPQAAEAAESRYLVADGYRQLARDVQEKIDRTVVESARLALTKEVQRLLAAAIAEFDATLAAIGGRQESGDLTAAEKSVLRNSHFFKGAALFELGRYEEAISAYSTATNRYQHSPEVLDAYVQISDCYRRLKKPAEARGTIEQAKVVLNQLPPNASFDETSSPTRQDWVLYLDWLSGL